MDGTQHLIKSVALLAVILIVGTFGYVIIEGWGTLDGLYMAVITLTTVGYSEVHEVSRAGRFFTIALIFLGGGFWIYSVGTVVQFMVEGRIREIMGRRKLDSRIERVADHYIVCGFGRIGRVICNQLKDQPTGMVVVEKKAEYAEALEAEGMLYVIGDASEEENLLKAGIMRAKFLVAALATDMDNVYLVLTARQLNPDLFIVARSGDIRAQSKLRAAGANRVECPYDMGATSMALRILRPTVTNFLDMALGRRQKEIQMEEVVVDPASRLVGVKLMDSGIRQELDLIIISIKRADGKMLFNPSSETKIMAGDTVIAVGDYDNLLKFERELNP